MLWPRPGVAISLPGRNVLSDQAEAGQRDKAFALRIDTELIAMHALHTPREEAR